MTVLGDRLFLFVCLFLFLVALSVAVHGFSLVAASGGFSSLWCTGFSLQWLFLAVGHRLELHGQHMDSAAAARRS